MPHVDLPQAEFKVVLLGDTFTGKTSLVLRFAEGYYRDSARNATVGAFFITKRLTVNGLTCKIQIWDTAGQEQFKPLAPMYYKNAAAAIICYDVTNPKSFDVLKFWLDELHRNVQAGRIVLAMAACKTDLLEQQQAENNNNRGNNMPQQEQETSASKQQTPAAPEEDDRLNLCKQAEQLAQHMGALYVPTSAKTNSNVNELFVKVAERVLQYQKQAKKGSALKSSLGPIPGSPPSPSPPINFNNTTNRSRSPLVMHHSSSPLHHPLANNNNNRFRSRSLSPKVSLSINTAHAGGVGIGNNAAPTSLLTPTLTRTNNLNGTTTTSITPRRKMNQIMDVNSATIHKYEQQLVTRGPGGAPYPPAGRLKSCAASLSTHSLWESNEPPRVTIGMGIGVGGGIRGMGMTSTTSASAGTKTTGATLSPRSNNDPENNESIKQTADISNEYKTNSRTISPVTTPTNDDIINKIDSYDEWQKYINKNDDNNDSAGEEKYQDISTSTMLSTTITNHHQRNRNGDHENNYNSYNLIINNSHNSDEETKDSKKQIMQKKITASTPAEAAYEAAAQAAASAASHATKSAKAAMCGDGSATDIFMCANIRQNDDGTASTQCVIS